MDITFRQTRISFFGVRVDLGAASFSDLAAPTMSFTARDADGNVIDVYLPAIEAVALGAELVELGKDKGVGG